MSQRLLPGKRGDLCQMVSGRPANGVGMQPRKWDQVNTEAYSFSCRGCRIAGVTWPGNVSDTVYDACRVYYK